MPALNTYKVTRTQEVVVRATDPLEAAVAATRYLNGEAVDENGPVIARYEQASNLSVQQTS